MTIAARHLQTRRPRKDRSVTWSRRQQSSGVAWLLWRRDTGNALHMSVVAAVEGDEMRGLCERLRKAWHELRDFVDEIDLKAIEGANDQIQRRR